MNLNEKILNFKHVETGEIVRVPLMTLLLGSGDSQEETNKVIFSDAVDEKFVLVD